MTFYSCYKPIGHDISETVDALDDVQRGMIVRDYVLSSFTFEDFVDFMVDEAEVGCKLLEYLTEDALENMVYLADRGREIEYGGLYFVNENRRNKTQSRRR